VAKSGRLKRLLEELKGKYDGLTGAGFYEVAVLESTIWKEVKFHKSPSSGPLPHSDKWFYENAGSPSRAGVRRRLDLLSLGPWASPLWDRITKEGMPLQTAYRLGLQAKRVHTRTGKPLDASLDGVLKEYVEGSIEVRRKDGLVFRKKLPSSKRRQREKESVASKPWSVSDTDADWADTDVDTSKQFRAQLRALTSEFVEKRLVDVEESVKEDLIVDFTLQVRVAYDDLLRRVHNHRRAPKFKLVEGIKHSSIKQACDCLGICPPERGQPVNVTVAYRAFMVLAGRYHPDRNQGSHDEKLLSQFYAVNSAWQLIQQYNEEQKGNE
jgi:hypothetical protein